MTDAATNVRALAKQCDGATFRGYVLAELRCAAMRARLAALDIEAAGLALRSGMIDADTALTWLADAGALDYVAPSPPDAAEPTP
jgi:hypothetical protein